MGVVQLEEAEIVIDGMVSVMVDVGTVVNLGHGWRAVVTLAGALCDCGKGVLCPLNRQFKESHV